MAFTITPEKIEEMKKFLQENPIDPKYTVPDGWVALDGDIPPAQLAARGCYNILKRLGELPEQPLTIQPRCTRTVVFSCPFLGGYNEESACPDACHFDRVDQPGTVQGELHLPAPVPAVLLHGRFAQH